MDERRVRYLIALAFPELTVRTIRPFGDGWANQAWLANESLVFRFPKTARAAASMLKEISLMPELANALPVPVPDFHYAAPAGAPGHPWPFAGYPLVPGMPVARLGRDSLGPGFAAAVGDFLTALHGFPVFRALALGVPGGTPRDWKAHYTDWYLQTRELIQPYLAPAEQVQVDDFIGGFLRDDRNFTFTPVLLHHDLSDDHLLADPATGVLTGVIDFEDAIVGDPAFDFIGLARLGTQVFDRYRGPRDEGFAGRMRFYTRLWPLHHLRHAAEMARPDEIQASLYRLREDLR